MHGWRTPTRPWELEVMRRTGKPTMGPGDTEATRSALAAMASSCTVMQIGRDVLVCRREQPSGADRPAVLSRLGKTCTRTRCTTLAAL